MTVIVKGMKMPVTCTLCDLAHAMKTSDGTAKLACAVVGKWQDNYTKRPSWCPLKEFDEKDEANLSFQNWELEEAGQFKIGDRIYSLLCKRNMSQRELAKATNITAASISRYIGNQRVPSATMIIKIADALGVTCDYLLGLSDKEG